MSQVQPLKEKIKINKKKNNEIRWKSWKEITQFSEWTSAINREDGDRGTCTKKFEAQKESHGEKFEILLDAQSNYSV